MSNKRNNLKAVLFDMDGVLINSMPYHTEAWHKAMKASGFNINPDEFYLHEGRGKLCTINIIYQRLLARPATQEEIDKIYNKKKEIFNKFPKPDPMPGALDLLQKVKEDGLIPMIITGSGQLSLLNRIETIFPGIFKRELIITSYDVKYCKPNPEPYLLALDKGGFMATESVVIENAPLGIQAGVAANIFTVAVNTGPLDNKLLIDSGADILFSSITELYEGWDVLVSTL